MNALLLVIGIFAAVALLVMVLERSNVRMKEETTAKISRWLWPLIMISLIVQLIMMISRS